MDTVRMFVNGQAMSGGSLHHALAGADFLGPVVTAPRYRFYSVADEFPGLYPAAADGQSVPGELYAMPYAMLRDSLLPREPAELELTAIELDDGSGCLSMRLRDGSLGRPDIVEISDRGGWLNYLKDRR